MCGWRKRASSSANSAQHDLARTRPVSMPTATTTNGAIASAAQKNRMPGPYPTTTDPLGCPAPRCRHSACVALPAVTPVREGPREGLVSVLPRTVARGPGG